MNIGRLVGWCVTVWCCHSVQLPTWTLVDCSIVTSLTTLTRGLSVWQVSIQTQRTVFTWERRRVLELVNRSLLMPRLSCQDVSVMFDCLSWQIQHELRINEPFGIILPCFVHYCKCVALLKRCVILQLTCMMFLCRTILYQFLPRNAYA